jgi:hypothetical protein
MKFEKLKPGMVVYDVVRRRMGNTTISTVAVWSVYIVSVDAEKRQVMASWNGNPPRTFGEHGIKKWRKKEPMLIRGALGSARLATREEIKAAKLAESDGAVS